MFAGSSPSPLHNCCVRACVEEDVGLKGKEEGGGGGREGVLVMENSVVVYLCGNKAVLQDKEGDCRTVYCQWAQCGTEGKKAYCC